VKTFHFKSGLQITVPGDPNCWLCQDRDWAECGRCPECGQPVGALWFWMDEINDDLPKVQTCSSLVSSAAASDISGHISLSRLSDRVST